MIRSILNFGTQLSLRDENGYQVGNLTIAANAELLGHSGSFVVIRNGGMIVTMDENQNTLGSVVLPSDYNITGINDGGFCARTSGLTIVYDKYCNVTNKY